MAPDLVQRCHDHLQRIIHGASDEDGDVIGLRRTAPDGDLQYPELHDPSDPVFGLAPLKPNETTQAEVPVVDVVPLEGVIVAAGTTTDLSFRFLFASHYPVGALGTNSAEAVTLAADPRYALWTNQCLEMLWGAFGDELAPLSIAVEIEELPFSEIDAALGSQ